MYCVQCQIESISSLNLKKTSLFKKIMIFFIFLKFFHILGLSEKNSIQTSQIPLQKYFKKSSIP